jgi:tetratricopeptide (TPR) repeat protein
MIPDSLPDIDVDHDALAQAQHLAWDAMEAPNMARCHALAMKALAISPFCADAYLLLRDTLPDKSDALVRLLKLAVEAGERALGDEFEELVGEFWGFHETRPYMRARHLLAMCLWDRGECDEAVAHYEAMLKLNPNDNQGIRYLLLPVYLELGVDAKARKLLRKYKGDSSAEWAYGAALLAFRESGDNAQGRKLLTKAFECNRYVPAYLIGSRRMPKRLPDYISPGKDSEAVSFCHGMMNAWRDTKDALPWLAAQWKKSPSAAN